MRSRAASASCPFCRTSFQQRWSASTTKPATSANTIGRLQEQLAGFEATRLVSAAETVATLRLVITAVDGWDTAGIKSLAAVASRTNGVFAVIVSSSSPASVAIARGPDVTLDASQLLKALVARFGGRGGGKPQMAQGGGLEAVPQSVVATAREIVESMLKNGSPS